MPGSTTLTTVLAARNSLSPVLNRINMQFGRMNTRLHGGSIAAAELSTSFGMLSDRVGSSLLNITKASMKVGVQLDFEMANIAAVTNKTKEQIDDLSEAFIQMSVDMKNAIPVDAATLASAGLNIARMGLKGDPLKFMTKTSAMIATISKDLDQLKAAEMISQSLRILSPDAFENVNKKGGLKKLKTEIDQFASAVVHASNQVTATPREILNFTKRLGPMAKSLGLSTYETIGFSAAAANLGKKAEQAARPLSKLFVKIIENKDIIANMFGITVEDLNKKLQDQKGGAAAIVLDVIKAFGKDQDTMIQLFEEIGVGTRDQFVSLFAGLSANMPMIREKIFEAQKGFMDANKHILAFQKIMESVQKKTELFVARIKNIGIKLFMPIKDDLKLILDIGNSILQWVLQLDDSILKAVSYGVLLTGTFLVFSGVLLTIAGTMLMLQFMLKTLIAASFPAVGVLVKGTFGQLYALFYLGFLKPLKLAFFSFSKLILMPVAALTMLYAAIEAIAHSMGLINAAAITMGDRLKYIFRIAAWGLIIMKGIIPLIFIWSTQLAGFLVSTTAKGALLNGLINKLMTSMVGLSMATEPLAALSLKTIVIAMFKVAAVLAMIAGIFVLFSNLVDLFKNDVGGFVSVGLPILIGVVAAFAGVLSPFVAVVLGVVAAIGLIIKAINDPVGFQKFLDNMEKTLIGKFMTTFANFVLNFGYFFIGLIYHTFKLLGVDIRGFIELFQSVLVWFIEKITSLFNMIPNITDKSIEYGKSALKSISPGYAIFESLKDYFSSGPKREPIKLNDFRYPTEGFKQTVGPPIVPLTSLQNPMFSPMINRDNIGITNDTPQVTLASYNPSDYISARDAGRASAMTMIASMLNKNKDQKREVYGEEKEFSAKITVPVTVYMDGHEVHKEVIEGIEEKLKIRFGVPDFKNAGASSMGYDYYI